MESKTTSDDGGGDGLGDGIGNCNGDSIGGGIGDCNDDKTDNCNSDGIVSFNVCEGLIESCISTNKANMLSLLKLKKKERKSKPSEIPGPYIPHTPWRVPYLY